MGLNRLDDDSGIDRIASTLQPPTDWVELEERRRVYWGAFCVDSHASISTGWPSLINAGDVSVHCVFFLVGPLIRLLTRIVGDNTLA